MKFLAPPAPGVFDYALVLLLALAPFTLELTGATAWLCYGLAAAYLLLGLGTNFPMGVLRLWAYRLHGGVELISSLVLLLSPFVFGFAQRSPASRNFFLGLGAALLVLWFLTDWSGKAHSEMPDDPHDNLLGNPDSV